MRICIFTQALLNNYGGILQNYALQTVLKQMNYDAITIDYVQKNHYKPLFVVLLKRVTALFLNCFLGKKTKYYPFSKFQNRKLYIDNFVKNNINMTTPVKRYDKNILKKYLIDSVIVGSDQVWRPKYNHYIKDMFLEFCKKEKGIKRISYASSFGVDEWEYSPKQTRTCSALAKRFNAISVREESGVFLCRDYLGVNATWVLDPTLLLTKEDYLKLCENIHQDKSKVLAVYMLDVNNAAREYCEKKAKEHGLIIRYFTADSKATLSVPEWLAMFRDASYVVTDSFHGTVFSIIFEKEFKCFYNENRGASRFESLLNLYNSGKLDEMREFSINWLKKALE